jgi:hypothetical protein
MPILGFAALNPGYNEMQMEDREWSWGSKAKSHW